MNGTGRLLDISRQMWYNVYMCLCIAAPTLPICVSALRDVICRKFADRKCDLVENENSAPKKSERIISWLSAKTNGKDLIWVALLYLAGVAVHFVIGNFPRKVNVLADEALYFSMAQSIHNGGGPLCLNAHTGFNKVMYPLLLSPLFGIDDPVMRVKMITLFNSALILSSVFLVYLIGKELKLCRGTMILAVLITLLFPDLMYSNSFMSENLAFPLVLLAVWVWLKSEGCEKRGRRLVYSAALGCLGYIGYLCKDTFLAFLLTFAVFELLYPLFLFLVYRKDAPDKKIREYYNVNALIGCGTAITVFTLCFVLGNILLFGGGANHGGVISGGLNKLFGNAYAFFYLLYAFVYYLSASVIAVLALPIVLPAARFKETERDTQSVFSFLILYLVISCAMVAYTIGINEDIGASLPRVHLRYMGAILLLLIVVFLKFPQDKPEERVSGKQCAATVMISALACAVMKGINYVTIDQSMLNVYLMMSEKLPPLTHVKDDLVFYPASAAFFLILTAVALIVVYYKNRSSRKAAVIFAAFTLAVCFQNNRLEIEEYRTDFSADPEMISEIMTANGYLDDIGGQKRILYISNENRAENSKLLITYFDHTENICHSNVKDIGEMAGESGVIDVRNAEFRTNFYGFTYSYDRFDGFDYIITDGGSEIELKGVTPISEASGDFYALYKNDDPAAVEIIPRE